MAQAEEKMITAREISEMQRRCEQNASYSFASGDKRISIEPELVLRLIDAFERAKEVLEFYSDMQNWHIPIGHRPGPSYGVKASEINAADLGKNELGDFIGGKRAREFLASLDGGEK